MSPNCQRGLPKKQGNQEKRFHAWRILPRTVDKNYPLLTHPFWLVVSSTFHSQTEAESHRDFVQADILDSSPHNRRRGVAGKSSATAASTPSCPSVTIRSIWVAPRARKSCSTQRQPSLPSSAQARSAKTSLLPSRSTARAVKMMVASAWS